MIDGLSLIYIHQRECQKPACHEKVDTPSKLEAMSLGGIKVWKPDYWSGNQESLPQERSNAKNNHGFTSNSFSHKPKCHFNMNFMWKKMFYSVCAQISQQ
jgi:hypothetical protein